MQSKNLRDVFAEINALHQRGAISFEEAEKAFRYKKGAGWDLAVESLKDARGKPRILRATRTSFEIIREPHGTYLVVGQLHQGGRSRDLQGGRSRDLLLPMNCQLTVSRYLSPSFQDLGYRADKPYPVTEAGHVPVLLVFYE
jgi:hypothetical protein